MMATSVTTAVTVLVANQSGTKKCLDAAKRGVKVVDEAWLQERLAAGGGTMKKAKTAATTKAAPKKKVATKAATSKAAPKKKVAKVKAKAANTKKKKATGTKSNKEWNIVKEHSLDIDNLKGEAPSIAASLPATLVSLNCAGALGTNKDFPNSYYFGESEFEAMNAIMEAAPATLEVLALPDNMSHAADSPNALATTLGRLSQLRSLRLESAVTGSSDQVPSFVDTLLKVWLPRCPKLTSLKLECALHSARKNQLPALAKKLPSLTELDLSGNLLWRQPKSSLTGCFGKLKQLKLLVIGLDETRMSCSSRGEKESLRGSPDAANEGWAGKEDVVAAVRACLPAGCELR